MMLFADAGTVPEIVAAVGPEPTLEDMVGVHGRPFAHEAFAAVPREHGSAELVAGKQDIFGRGFHETNSKGFRYKDWVGFCLGLVTQPSLPLKAEKSRMNSTYLTGFAG
jgi:hypothetical protein